MTSRETLLFCAAYLAAILFSDNRNCPSSSTCTKFTKYSNVLLLILYERISGRVVFLFLNVNFSAGWFLRIAFQISDHFLTSSPIHAFEGVLPFESRVRTIVLLIEESCSQSLLQKIPIKSIRSFPGNQPLIFGQLWTLIVGHTSQILLVFWNRISGSSSLPFPFRVSLGPESNHSVMAKRQSEWITFQALAQYRKRRKRNACGMDIAYLFLYSSGIKHRSNFHYNWSNLIVVIFLSFLFQIKNWMLFISATKSHFMHIHIFPVGARGRY